MDILKKIFGTKNARDTKRIKPIVAEINRIEAEYQAKNLADEDFPRMTAEFKRRVAEGETLDHILPEAFALVKNACRHLVGTTEEVCGHVLTWDMVPFDCQLVGGIVLHQGKIAEMQTGEGKTLVATLPLYERPRREERAARDGERLPRPARRDVDGPPLQVPRPHGGLHPEHDGLGRAPRAVPL